MPNVLVRDVPDEVHSALQRKRWLRRTLTDQRFAAAIAHLQQLDFDRTPTLRLMPRAFEPLLNRHRIDRDEPAVCGRPQWRCS